MQSLSGLIYIINTYAITIRSYIYNYYLCNHYRVLYLLLIPMQSLSVLISIIKPIQSLSGLTSIINTYPITIGAYIYNKYLYLNPDSSFVCIYKLYVCHLIKTFLQ